MSAGINKLISELPADIAAAVHLAAGVDTKQKYGERDLKAIKLDPSARTIIQKSGLLF